MIRREIRANGGAVWCAVCGVGPLDPDAAPGSRYAIDAGHVVPVALGGTDTLANLRPECPRCNRGEGRRIAEEKAHRERQAAATGPRPRPTRHGFYDVTGRWAPTTREW